MFAVERSGQNATFNQFILGLGWVHPRRTLYQVWNKDAVWSLVLLLVTGVRADPNHSHSYDIICMYVRIVTFDFSLNYFIFLVGTW